MPYLELLLSAKTMSEIEDFAILGLESTIVATAFIPQTEGETCYGSGYSTPMTPISVDFPSMTPTVTSLDATFATPSGSSSSNKRQRTFSLVLDDLGVRSRACSFEVTSSSSAAGAEADFQQIWESLGVEPTPVLFTALVDTAPSPSSSRPTRASGRRTVTRRQQSTQSRGNIVATPAPSPSPSRNSGGMSTGLPSRCSPEQRRAKVVRYLEKRKRRVWRKEIKYSCRKQFAESRPRVAGRFIPKKLQQQQELVAFESPNTRVIGEANNEGGPVVGLLM